MDKLGNWLPFCLFLLCEVVPWEVFDYVIAITGSFKPQHSGLLDAGGCLVGWLVGCLVSWPAGQSLLVFACNQLVGWLVCWPAGLWAGWLVAWGA
jgi:hypothetical protein